MDLTKNHIALTTSLGVQEEAHQKLLSLLEMANLSANTTFEKLFGMVGTLGQSLDDINVKVQSWNRNGMGQTWMPLGALILGSGILLGREGGRIVLVLAGAISSYRLICLLILPMLTWDEIVGIILFFIGSLCLRDFVEILHLRDLRLPSTAIGVSSEGGLDVKNYGILSRGLAVWAGSVFAVVVAISLVAFRRRRCPVPMDKDLE